VKGGADLIGGGLGRQVEQLIVAVPFQIGVEALSYNGLKRSDLLC